MAQNKSKPDQARRSGGKITSGAAKTRRAPIASEFDRRAQKPFGMIFLRQMCQQPSWNDILTKKHRGWGYVPSSYPHRSERLGRASKLECKAREDVLKRFLLGWSAAIQVLLDARGEDRAGRRGTFFCERPEQQATANLLSSPFADQPALAPYALDSHVREGQVELALETGSAEGGQLLA
jgi:hypothetical protein